MQSKKSLYNVVKHVLDLKKHHEGQSLGFPQQKISMKQSLAQHEINFGLHHFRMIDEFTRHSNAVIIKNK